MSASVRHEAAKIREQWLGSALSTLPADRPAAEAAISGLYRLIGLGPPRFHWVSSPLMGWETIPPGTRPRPPETADRVYAWPLPSRFAAEAGRLSAELDAVALRAGPSAELIRREVRDRLTRSYIATLQLPLQAAHAPHGVGTAFLPQSVAWLAYYDALRHAAGVVFTAGQNRRLGLWAAAARSCAWWWPRTDTCVVSERHVEAYTEEWGDGGEVWLHNADGPAIRYADGWELYVWHGRPVPSWVITDPSVDRIERETNVEVRRCAIENLGWAAYVEQAGLRPVAAAPDPGNPGFELRLYDMRRRTRVLIAVNGSVERDGHRRRYGLTVPAWIEDPVAAAGWTYGLSAEQYSLLLRRT